MGLQGLTQYFKVTIYSPKGAKKQTSIDATDYIDSMVKLVDEDGLIKECTFKMTDGMILMDILSIGMRVDLTGGSLQHSQFLFSGAIKSITPEFLDSGSVELTIVAHSGEGGKLGIGVKDVIYPSNNHAYSWARQELMYSDIIVNLAKEQGIRVLSENLDIRHDKKAGFKIGTTRQHNKTDWDFMQLLADKIGCTLWTEEEDGISKLYLKDNGGLVSKFGRYTFFFLSRSNDGSFPFKKTSAYQIQVLKAKVNLDTSNAKGKITQTTNSATGKTEVTSTDSNGDQWVLDEDKLIGMSSEARRDLIDLFLSGKITWDGDNGTVAAKSYFKKASSEESSREGESNNTEIEIAGSNLSPDGLSSTDGTTTNTGSTSKRVVVDDAKLKSLSSEERSSILGRIVRNELTEDDKKYYKTVDTTPKEGKADGDSTTAPPLTNSVDSGKSKKKKNKRDAGFNIEIVIYGNLAITTKKSYVLEGLGKYSGSYYLFKVTHEWGNNGYIMTLVFTK